MQHLIQDRTSNLELDRRFANIGIRISAPSGRLVHYLGRILKERHDAKLHLYVRNEVEQKGIARQDKEGLWDTIEIGNLLHRDLQAPVHDPNTVIARARVYEAKIGETINRLAMEHRQLGRGYSPGGDGAPRSPVVARATYIQMLNAFNETLGFWEKEITTKKLTLVLNAEKWVAALCRAHDVQYRKLGLGRTANFQFWATDEYFTNPFLEPTYNSLTHWPTAEISGSYAAQISKNKRMLANASWLGAGKSLLSNFVRRPIDRLRGIDSEGPSLWGAIQASIEPTMRLRKYQRLAKTKLSDLEGKSFVYFPLGKEPELSTMIRTPEYLSQQAAIIGVSRDLPAGVLLAVKEHIPATAQRTSGFYEQIADLKNVVLIDLFEPSIELIQRAAATITNIGSAGTEAAILGRPVIQFSPHTHNHFLPHVMTVTSERELKGFLDRALNEEMDLAQAREDGARFFEAIKNSCFDMGSFLRVRGGTYGATLENADVLYHGLVRSLNASTEVTGVELATRHI